MTKPSRSQNSFDFQHTWPPTRIGATVGLHFAISQSACQLTVGEKVDWTGDGWPNASCCGNREKLAVWGKLRKGCDRLSGHNSSITRVVPGT